MSAPDAELSKRLQRAIMNAVMAECRSGNLVVIPFPEFADALLTVLTMSAAEVELFDDPAQLEAFAQGISFRVRKYVPAGRRRKAAAKTGATAPLVR